MWGDPRIIASLITAGLALLTAAIVAFLNHRSALRQRRFEKETQLELVAMRRRESEELEYYRTKSQERLARLEAEFADEREARRLRTERESVVSRYRDPLLHASYDLQSRIFNIVRRQFLQAFFVDGTAREKEYAIENTVFLIAQFLGWTEIVRQEVRFIDLENEERTRKLRELQDSIYAHFQTDALGRTMRLFAGEQRAVGELMIEDTADGKRCIGFAAFLNRRNPELDRWLDPLRDDLKVSAGAPERLSPRLLGIQGSLIDILDLLDPDRVYFPAHSRSKLAP